MYDHPASGNKVRRFAEEMERQSILKEILMYGTYADATVLTSRHDRRAHPLFVYLLGVSDPSVLRSMYANGVVAYLDTKTCEKPPRVNEQHWNRAKLDVIRTRHDHTVRKAGSFVTPISKLLMLRNKSTT